MIERFNETLGHMIKKFVDRNKTNWDKHLDLLLAAYSATPHPATGYSPNMLMFGREINIPSNILYPLYVSELRDGLEETYHTVRKTSNSQHNGKRGTMTAELWKMCTILVTWCTKRKVLGKSWTQSILGLLSSSA